MKKTLYAISCILTCGVAHSQSTVTVFGILDSAVLHASNSGKSSINQLATSGWNVSRFGFRGAEDLGGGNRAIFWLESAVLIDTGTVGGTNTNNQTTGATAAGTFAYGRRATVSLAGDWGEVRLGRDLDPQVLSLTYYDPFFNTGVGASQTFNTIITGPTAVRASNAISYLTKVQPYTNNEGFYGHAMYYLGENPSNTPIKNDGTGGSVRFGWVTKKWEATAATSRTSYAAGTVRQSNVGGQFMVGPWRPSGSYSWDRNGPLSARGFNIGATGVIDLSEIRLSYSQYHIKGGLTSPMARKLAIGYGYNFSKRSVVYAVAARVRNSGGSTAPVGLGLDPALPNRNSSGIEAGIRHSF